MRIFTLILISAVNAATKEECDIREIVNDIGLQMNQTPEEIEKEVSKLHNHWLGTCESISEVSDEELVGIGLPIGLTRQLKRRVNEIEDKNEVSQPQAETISYVNSFYGQCRREDFDKDTNEEKGNDTENKRNYKRAIGAIGGGIVGTLLPSATYAIVGLGSSGPVAGGLFAGAQAAGGVAAGSSLAVLQAAAMTGPLAPVVIAGAALGGLGYYIFGPAESETSP